MLKQTAAAAKAAHEQNLARHRDDSDMFVRPGLLANRKEKWVRLWARATSVRPSDAIEFFVIPEDSAKDYEALAVTFAKPSDVHAALEFVGLKPGRPVNFAKNQYWPRGERVIMHFEWEQPPAEGEAGNPTPQRFRAEDLNIDTRTSKTLPREGLVFTGSFTITPGNGDKPLYAADVMDSKSIASNYNDRCTVLDVPRQAPQGSVYGFQKLNPAMRFTPHQPVMVQLEPEHKDGTRRILDATLRISMPAGSAAPQAAIYSLTDPQGRSLAAGTTLGHLLAAFGKLTESGRDPFVSLKVDDAMTLQSVRQVYGMLTTLDNERGIRIEAPPEGHLYYRAFFPSEEWRDRTKRLGRPWELHLVEKDHKLAGTLILPADDIDDNNGQGDLKFTIGSAEQLATTLKEKSGRFSQTVYIYAPRTLNYGELMSFIRPSLESHPLMWVFL